MANKKIDWNKMLKDMKEQEDKAPVLVKGKKHKGGTHNV